MDRFDVRHFKTERIAQHTRFYIATHLGLKSWIDNPEAVKRIIDGQPRNVNVHCAALCLYANAIQTKLLETHIDKLKPVLSLSNEEMLTGLSQKPKFANYTREQLQEELAKIINTDIRNAFAHGLFEIYCPNKNPKNGVFVLEPNRSYLKTIVDDINMANGVQNDENKQLKYRIAITFDTVNQLLHQYVVLKSIAALHTTDYVKRALTKKLGESIDDFLVPSTISYMIDKYMGSDNNTISKSLNNPVVQGYVQNVLSFATLVYDQNMHHSLEGCDDDLFALESAIRNSTIHNNTHLGTNGSTQIIADPAKIDDEDVIEDNFVTISMVMELLHSQLYIFTDKIKSGEITQEQYDNMSAADRLQYVVDQIKDLGNDKDHEK